MPAAKARNATSNASNNINRILSRFPPSAHHIGILRPAISNRSVRVNKCRPIKSTVPFNHVNNRSSEGLADEILRPGTGLFTSGIGWLATFSGTGSTRLVTRGGQLKESLLLAHPRERAKRYRQSQAFQL